MSSHSEGNPGPGLKSIHYRRVVDLSHVIHPGMPQWPGDPPAEFTSWATLDAEGYNLRRVSLGEHAGTHMNAPASFHAGGLGIDGYDAGSLVAPASVIDVTQLARVSPDFELGVDHVARWEQANGRCEPGTVVLLCTGWSHKWQNPQQYLGMDDNGVSHFPGFGVDVVEYLLRDRGIAGVGIDTHGVDPGMDNTYAVNRLVLQQPRLVLENLTSLDQLPPTGATLVIGVIRLQGGGGSPVSVLAFVP